MSAPEDQTDAYLSGIQFDPAQFPDLMYGWPYRKKSPFVKDRAAAIKALRKMEMREDDVIIAAYPKCGTHWVWEVVKMLRKGRADIESRTKETVMLEFQDVEHIAAMTQDPGPRTLNSHNAFCHLPQQIVDKKVKIIHLVRNPKDVIVSLLYHARSRPGLEDLSFDTQFHEYTTNTMQSPNQLWYERQMQAWRSVHPDHPVCTVTYEDMKRTPLEITCKIAKFLGLDVSTELCQEVVEACSIENMRATNEGRKMPDHIMTDGVHDKFKPYRKGIIGDWKNHFTVAQNEVMDAYIEQETRDLDVGRLFTYG